MLMLLFIFAVFIPSKVHLWYQIVMANSNNSKCVYCFIKISFISVSIPIFTDGLLLKARERFKWWSNPKQHFNSFNPSKANSVVKKNIIFGNYWYYSIEFRTLTLVLCSKNVWWNICVYRRNLCVPLVVCR